MGSREKAQGLARAGGQPASEEGGAYGIPWALQLFLPDPGNKSCLMGGVLRQLEGEWIRDIWTLPRPNPSPGQR